MKLSEDERHLARWLAEHAATPATGTSFRDHRTGAHVQLTSLADARRRYVWRFTVGSGPFAAKGRTFDESETWWGEVQTALRGAVTTGDAEATHLAAAAILQWGGTAPHNVPWLASRRSELPRLFADAADALDLDQGDDRLPRDLRFNAGFSKVYAALVDDLVIYDSRVAAALAQLSIHAWGSADRVPVDMRFPTTTGRTKAIRTIRTPGWPKLRPGLGHARAAKHASRILRHAVTLLAEAGGDPILRSGRDLEAALFMYGYDLTVHSRPADVAPVGVQSAAPPAPRTSVATQQDVRFPLATHGSRTRAFTARDVAPGVELQNEHGRTDTFTWSEIATVLHALARQFDKHQFPLANNVQKLGNGTERSGLGTTILGLPGADKTKAQAASYLGPLLVALGLLEWNGKKVGIAWKLTTEDTAEFEPANLKARFEAWRRKDSS